jgi:peptidoglycan/LPS O-acetylase OafA/YrhL
VRANRATSADLVPTRRFGQVPSLDGLRGVAVLIVVVAHLEIILPLPTLLVIPGGTVSLDSFFVLSGFLITVLMLREQGTTGRIRKLAFYERRILRLYPALLFMVVGQVVSAYVTHISFHEEWTSVLSVLFYYSNWKLAVGSNYFGGHIANGFQQVWSLSFEEQFYLVWPWVTVFLLTIRTRFRTVVIALVGAIVVIGVHRALLYHGPATWYGIFIRTDTRADSMLWGALAAHLWIRNKEPKRALPYLATIGGIFLLVALPLTDTTGPFLYRGGFDAIDVSCACVILAFVNGWRVRRLFEWRPLVVVGTMSYAIYLWHIPVFFTVAYFDTHWPDAVRVIVSFAATGLFATVSWHFLERPALKWKERLAVVGKREVGPLVRSRREPRPSPERTRAPSGPVTADALLRTGFTGAAADPSGPPADPGGP